MLRIRSSSRLMRQGAVIGMTVLPVVAASARVIPDSRTAGAVWYHDGLRQVQILPSAETLNVVLKPAFVSNPPDLVLEHAIDRRNRHVLVRPPNVDAARRAYLALEEVEAVQSVYYSSEQSRRTNDAAGRLTANGRIAIRVNDGTVIEGILSDFELTRLRTVAYCDNTLIARVAEGADAVRIARNLFQSGRVLFAVPQFARWADPRDLPNDPFFGDQWHLRNTGQGRGRPGADLNIVGAWELARGASSIIAVVDNGVDLDHADLAGNVDHRVSYDFNDRDDDPRPSCNESHGTTVAGINGAVTGNNLGVSGVAPNAGLGAIRLTASAFSDEDTADALLHRLDIVGIYNNSWGPSDNGQTIEGPGVLTTAALEFGITNGRDGLGAIYVWAGGNGEQSPDDANFDGFVNSRYTIAVGASNNMGAASSYSEHGACILINAPSSFGTMSITTTDNSGGCGGEPGDYTFSAGGTSASAPMVAGVVALMLEINSALSWRDVQHILLLSATQNDPDDPGWVLNAAGLPIHPQLGFGRVNAEAAVRLSAAWDGVIPAGLPQVSAAELDVSQSPIPDFDPNGVQLMLDSPDRFVVEYVEVTVDITHERRGDLEIVLTSPGGTPSVLASPRPSDFGENLNWTFMTVRHWNEPAEGRWTLNVRDLQDGGVGTFHSWELTIHGRHLDLPRGDLNGDGAFNSLDITEFFIAIFDPQAYALLHPGLSGTYLGDFDGNGMLNALDRPGFASGLFR